MEHLPVKTINLEPKEPISDALSELEIDIQSAADSEIQPELEKLECLKS